MGYWNIDVKCSKCGHTNWVWDEHPILEQIETEAYQEGYKDARVDEEDIKKMHKQVSTMKDLLAANARVIREELRKEIEEDLVNKKEADNAQHKATASATPVAPSH